MVEIEKCQLRDTRLDVQSPFARRIFQYQMFEFLKTKSIFFIITLSIDNQWTVE